MIEGRPQLVHTAPEREQAERVATLLAAVAADQHWGVVSWVGESADRPFAILSLSREQASA